MGCRHGPSCMLCHVASTSRTRIQGLTGWPAGREHLSEGCIPLWPTDLKMCDCSGHFRHGPRGSQTDCTSAPTALVCCSGYGQCLCSSCSLHWHTSVHLPATPLPAQLAAELVCRPPGPCLKAPCTVKRLTGSDQTAVEQPAEGQVVATSPQDEKQHLRLHYFTQSASTRSTQLLGSSTPAFPTSALRKQWSARAQSLETPSREHQVNSPNIVGLTPAHAIVWWRCHPMRSPLRFLTA